MCSQMADSPARRNDITCLPRFRYHAVLQMGWVESYTWAVLWAPTIDGSKCTKSIYFCVKAAENQIHLITEA